MIDSLFPPWSIQYDIDGMTVCAIVDGDKADAFDRAFSDVNWWERVSGSVNGLTVVTYRNHIFSLNSEATADELVMRLATSGLCQQLSCSPYVSPAVLTRKESPEQRRRAGIVSVIQDVFATMLDRLSERDFDGLLNGDMVHNVEVIRDVIMSRTERLTLEDFSELFELLDDEDTD